MSKLDMNEILEELVLFEGISHGCIYKNERECKGDADESDEYCHRIANG